MNNETMVNSAIKALAAMQVCPKQPGASDYCNAHCEYCNKPNCHATLVNDCTKVLTELLAASSAKAEVKPVDLTLQITDIIRDIGVPANIVGYKYVRYAIILAVRDSEYVMSITKLLYPTIAAEFNTTPSRVERGIRHAVERAFNSIDTDTYAKYFGNTVNPGKDKPTNSEFIAGIADRIKLANNM